MKKILYSLIFLSLFAFNTQAQDSTLVVFVETTDTYMGTCTGEATVTVYGEYPPYTYYWNTGETTQTITGLCEGIYTVVVNDSNGNSATATGYVGFYGDTTDIYGCTDPMALNYNPDATIDDGSCVYDSLPGDSLIWGCTDPTALNYNPYATADNGTCIYEYPDSTTDVYGCTDYLALNYNPYATIDDGSCVYDYGYYEIDTCIEGITDAYIMYYELIDSSTVLVVWEIEGATGTYTFTIEYPIEETDLLYAVLTIFCDETKSTVSYTFTEIIDLSITGIQPVVSSSELLVYPNPSDGRITMSIKGVEEETRLDIVNVTGQLIYSQMIYGDFNEQINLSDNTKGIYFLRITNSTTTETKKLIFR